MVALDDSVSTKGVKEDASADIDSGSAEYNGTASANILFCLERTIRRRKISDNFELSNWDERTFELILSCDDFESILRFVDDNTGLSNKACILALFDYIGNERKMSTKIPAYL